MINKIFSILFPEPKSNLEIVLKKIADQDNVRNANITMSMLTGESKDIDVDKDLKFIIGKKHFTGNILSYKSFTVKFGDKDNKCIVTLRGCDEPLFLFDNAEEVKQIRAAVKSKYNEMLKREAQKMKDDFDAM